MWGLCLAFIILLSERHRFGEWDAWALWNMKTKFLVAAGVSWKDLLTKLHWHTQPDYPLLLPFINVWIYATCSSEVWRIAQVTAVLLTFSSGLLLYCGLRQFFNRGVAFLISCVLLSHPYFAHLGTAQYADVLLSYLLLASFIFLTAAIRQGSAFLAMLAGIFLGIMGFAKNEGVMMAFILLALSLPYLFFQKRTDAACFIIIRRMLAGFGIFFAVTLVFKIFLSPPNRDVFTNLTSGNLAYLNLKGLGMIYHAVVAEMLQKRWIGIGPVILFLIAVKLPGFFRGEAAIFSVFFLLYFLLVSAVYLTNASFDLSWRLTSTIPRIFGYLLPSILFVCFYVHLKEGTPN